jgi:hypothetical protein
MRSRESRGQREDALPGMMTAEDVAEVARDHGSFAFKTHLVLQV